MPATIDSLPIHEAMSIAVSYNYPSVIGDWPQYHEKPAPKQNKDVSCLCIEVRKADLTFSGSEDTPIFGRSMHRMEIALGTIDRVLVFLVAQLLSPGQFEQLDTMLQVWQTVVRKVWMVVVSETICN